MHVISFHKKTYSKIENINKLNQIHYSNTFLVPFFILLVIRGFVSRKANV